MSAGRRPTRRPRKPAATLTRRRFVSLLAAGTAAVAASPALAAPAPVPAKKPKPAAAKPPATAPSSAALQKEYERQKKGTLETLATLRKFALPPGGELPVVFRPLRPTRKER